MHLKEKENMKHWKKVLCLVLALAMLMLAG